MVGTESSTTGTTGLGGIQSSVQGGMQPNVIDYNHPLFLNPSDVSGAQIISFQLTGIENYSIWHRSIPVALLGRNKLGMIDGTCTKDKFPSELGNNWERVNAVVLSWIMNFVAKELLGGIMYTSIAKEVWDDLYERFHKIDDVRTFNLHKNIASLSQENMSVCAYFSKLKDLWDEFKALVPAPNCECDKSKDFVVHLQKLKLFQFLMGLNESYLQARSQILLMSHLPSVNQAYAMIVSDESHKAVATSVGVLGVRPGAQLRDYEVAMYSRNQGQRLNKNSNVQCDFCKLKGHTKENCWKLIGYPPNFKTKRNQRIESGVAYNVVAGQSSEQCSQVKARTCDQEDFEVQMSMISQIGKAVFTQEQYNQILKMIHTSSTSTQETEAADAANVAGSLHWEGESNWKS